MVRSFPPRGFFHDGASTAASLLEEISSCLAEIRFFQSDESSSDLLPNFSINSLYFYNRLSFNRHLGIGTTTNHLTLQLEERGWEERRENNGNYDWSTAIQ